MVQKFHNYNLINENLGQARSLIRRNMNISTDDVRDAEKDRFSTDFQLLMNELGNKKKKMKDYINRLEIKLDRGILSSYDDITDPLDPDGQRIQPRDLLHKYRREIRKFELKKEVLRIYSKIKNVLNENNQLGFIGHLTKLLVENYNDAYPKSVYTNDIRHAHFTYILSEMSDRSNIDSLRCKESDEKMTIQDFDSVQKLYDAFVYGERYRKFKSKFLSELPRAQKDLIWKGDKLIVNDKYDFLRKCERIYQNSHNLSLFLSKVSRIRTIQDMKYEISSILNEIDWSIEFIERYLKGVKDLKVLYKADNKLVAEVYNHTAVSKGSLKTNWCIKHKNHFDSHTSNGRIQLILYDFNKDLGYYDSIIGITVDGENAKKGKNSGFGYVRDMYDRIDYNLMSGYNHGANRSRYRNEEQIDFILNKDKNIDMYKLYKRKPGFFNKMGYKIKRFFDIPNDPSDD